MCLVTRPVLTSIVISSDKDLMQLIDDQTTLFDSMKNKDIGIEEVKEKFGVTPDKVIEVQALAGDSSDNIPGVPSIGVKTAAELINEFGSVENLLKNVDKIKQPKRRQTISDNKDNALISKKLVTLKDDVPTVEKIEDFIVKDLDKGKIISFFIIFIIVLGLGLTGSISKLNGLKFNEDLAFFSIILNKSDIFVSLIVLIFSLCLTISTVDTLLNSISSGNSWSFCKQFLTFINYSFAR